VNAANEPGQCRDVDGDGICACERDVVECHREETASGDIICVGICPPGELCTRIGIPGTNDIDCVCEPKIDECHLAFDAANTPTCEGACPDGSNCKLVEDSSTPAGVECICEPVDECTLEIIAGVVDCSGACEDGTGCQLVGDPDAPNGFDCTCDPANEPCHVETDAAGNVSCVGGCPIAGVVCEAFTITNPDGTPGIDCRCPQ
jgi:hypothetical protein